MFESLSKSTRPAGETPAVPAITIGRISILFGLALLATAGCSKKPVAAPVAIAPPKPDPWILSCNDPNTEEPALLWNGVLGVRIGRDGTFVGNRFEIDSYETTGEEKIIPLPSLRRVTWFNNGKLLGPVNGESYRQNLDMGNGILVTTWNQDGLKIETHTAIDPQGWCIAQDWIFEGDTRGLEAHLAKEVALNKSFELEYGLGLRRDRHDPVLKTANQDKVRIPINIGKSVFVRFIWADWSRMKGLKGRLEPFFESGDAWFDRWKTDIQIDGPVEDQQAIRSFMFYLRGAIEPDCDMSISPFGLSDATYNGHVFWDADTWVFPALALIDPERAKAIAEYRLAMFGKNALPRMAGEGGDAGKMPAVPAIPPFPWESSVSGKEVAPEAMRKEIHINGDVAWMLDNAAALGLVKQQDAENVIKKVASFYQAKASQRPDGKFDLKDVVSPDEFHTGDNDLYTNLLANWTQKRTKSKLEFYLPRDKETYLTYDNDPIRGYKQAAAVLGIYPLQMINDAEARKMMDRYADKVTKNGPAMSHSVHALIWARLGESEKAYDEWKKSWQLYTNHPLMLFSEKPKKKTTYFTTGAAGCLQTVLYGFLGFRIDYEKDKMAAWSTPLNNGKWISIHPRLPAKWKSVKFTNFTVKGKRYNLTIDASGVKVNQGEP